jgi:hypothetical protein
MLVPIDDLEEVCKGALQVLAISNRPWKLLSFRMNVLPASIWSRFSRVEKLLLFFILFFSLNRSLAKALRFFGRLIS